MAFNRCRLTSNTDGKMEEDMWIKVGRPRLTPG